MCKHFITRERQLTNFITRFSIFIANCTTSALDLECVKFTVKSEIFKFPTGTRHACKAYPDVYKNLFQKYDAYHPGLNQLLVFSNIPRKETKWPGSLYSYENKIGCMLSPTKYDLSAQYAIAIAQPSA